MAVSFEYSSREAKTMFTLKLITVLAICTSTVHCYFTLPGKCPENVQLQSEFRLADFFNKWYQTHFYSSDGQKINNCSIVEVFNKPTGIYVNFSRIDTTIERARYSIAKLEIPAAIEDAANLNVSFHFEFAPRRLQDRTYSFRVLATNYNYYATAYTCSYNSLTNKHFIYVWILSRNEILNDVSKELALKPLKQLGIDTSKIVQDDKSTCNPKHYDIDQAEPSSFRYPVPIL